MKEKGLFGRFRTGLTRTREKLGSRLGFLFRSRRSEQEFFEEMEEILVSSDVGVETALKLVEEFHDRVREQALFGGPRMEEAFIEFLAEGLKSASLEAPDQGLQIILLLGANGSGKTTTAAKLGHRLQTRGVPAMLAAADTFRAAAIDQLSTWAKRVKLPLIRQQSGADPGAVVFDAINAARARNIRCLLVDTAGRFHNRVNLVKELQKIDKIIRNKLETPDQYQRIGVLDATAGSNAYAQAAAFHEAVELDGVILTKLDSSARGGVALAVGFGLDLPICAVGLGEGLEDLVDFQARAFAESLLLDAAEAAG